MASDSMRAPFQTVDSSDDSISTRTLTASDGSEDFPVEKVLAEEEFLTESGVGFEVKYLIKWKNWPVQASTFEPERNLHDDGGVLREWAKEKRRIEAGEREALDVDAWEVENERWRVEREERKARKARKRVSLGLSPRPRPKVARPVASDGDDSDSENGLFVDDGTRDEHDVGQPRKKPKLAPPPKKKGIARAKVKEVKHEESSESGDDEQSSDDVRLQSRVAPKKKGNASRAPVAPIARIANRQRVTTDAPARQNSSRDGSSDLTARPNPTTKPQVEQQTVPKKFGRPKLSGPSKQPQATKSSTAESINIFANWGAEAASTRKARTKSTTDPREMRFTSLSEQSRFHKSAAMEKAPDPSKLQMIDLSRPAPRAIMIPNGNTAPQSVSEASAALAAPTPTATTAPLNGLNQIVQATIETAATLNNRSSARREASRNGTDLALSATTERPAVVNRRSSAQRERTSLTGADQPISATAEIPAVFGRRSPPREERQRSITPPDQDRENSNVLRDDFQTHTCRDWKKTGSCPHGSKCYFAHYDVPNSMPGTSMSISSAGQAPATSLPPDPSKYRTQRCMRWAAGFCEFGDDCHFRHEDRTAPVRKVSAPQVVSGVPGRSERHRIECVFWRKGHCNRPDASCEYAHAKTGFYLDHPNDKEVQVDLSHASVSEAMNVDATRGGFPAHLFSRNVEQSNATSSLPQLSLLQEAVPAPPAPPIPAIMPSSAVPPHYTDGKQIECYYWRGPGECHNVGLTCRYAHHRTGWYTEWAGSRQVLRDHNTVYQEPTGIVGDVVMRDRSVVRTPVVATANEQLASDLHTALQESTADGMYAFTNPINLAISSGSKTAYVAVMLASTSQYDYERVRHILGRRGELTVSSMVSAAQFQVHFADILKQSASQHHPLGPVVMGPEDGDTVSKFAKACELHASAGIITSSDFTMLLFPSAADDLHFAAKSQGTLHAALSYKLLPPLPDPIDAGVEHVEPELSIKPDLKHYLAVSKELLGLNVEVLRKIAKGHLRRMFIMLPPSRKEENDLLRKIFLTPLKESDTPKVFTLLDGNEVWEKFLANYFKLGQSDAPCLLLVHPEIELRSIAQLGALLANTNTPVHYIGARHSLHNDEEAPSTYQSQLIFPHGDLLLLTDEAFTYDPFSTTQILKQATMINSGKIASHADYTTEIHIAASPTIRETLLNLATEGMGGMVNPLHVELWKAFNSFTEPSEHLMAASPPKTHLLEATDLHSYASLPPPQRTSHLVSWFGHYASWHARGHRRFSICGIESAEGEGRAMEWQRENAHCVIYTAGEFLGKLNKRKEGGEKEDRG
ncbi:hypothetical protein LTR95_016285, partial [Oleoguttula sp. CCFEE 5521]